MYKNRKLAKNIILLNPQITAS